jgi:hypothetical protein
MCDLGTSGCVLEPISGFASICSQAAPDDEQFRTTPSSAMLRTEPLAGIGNHGWREA